MILSARHIVMYPECNATENLFGGKMLAWIDEAAAIYASCQMATSRLVTAHMDAIDFKLPVPKGWVCNIYCETLREGNTSLTVGVRVTRKNFATGEESEVTNTRMVFVSLDENNQPCPWRKNEG